MKRHFVIVAAIVLVLCLFVSCNSAPSGSGGASSSASSTANASDASASGTSSSSSASGVSSSTGSLVVSAPTGANTPAEDSILRFNGIAGSARLIADMESGALPKSCVVLYDQMGTRPAVTVEDAETITKVYELLSDVKVGTLSSSSITDCYHQVAFTLQDGSVVRFSFEGEHLLSLDRENYEVFGGDPLWSFVRELQDEYMEAHPEAKV